MSIILTHKKTIDCIANLINAVIDVHVQNPAGISELEHMYGTDGFREVAQNTVIQLPRQFGHTTAAIDILNLRPSALLVTLDGRVRDLQRYNPDIAENIMNLRTALVPGNTVLAMLGRLSKLDCVIVVSIPITQAHIDTLYNIYSPKIMVFLGDTRILNQT